MTDAFEKLQDELIPNETEPVEELSPKDEAMEPPTLPSPEEATTEPPTLPSPEDELIQLRGEVEALRAALEQKQQEQARTLQEIGEFHRLFPETPIKDVPETVWKQVEGGIPLSAAYALYEKQTLQAQHRAEEINRQNATRSAGKAGRHASGEYFSPDEVRAMSQQQVHENYARIMASMKHWRNA